MVFPRLAVGISKFLGMPSAALFMWGRRTVVVAAMADNTSMTISEHAKKVSTDTAGMGTQSPLIVA